MINVTALERVIFRRRAKRSMASKSIGNILTVMVRLRVGRTGFGRFMKKDHIPEKNVLQYPKFVLHSSLLAHGGRLPKGKTSGCTQAQTPAGRSPWVAGGATKGKLT